MAAADERATFAFDLEGNISEQAPADADALEQMREALRGDIEELRNMNQAMRNMQAGGVVNIAIARQLRDAISAQKAKVGQAQQAYIAAGGSLRNMRPPQQVAVVGFKELGSVLQRLGGPLGGLIGRLGGLRALLVGGAVVGGVLAVAAALAALVVAGAAAIVMLTKYAIAQSDARRSELLRLEGLTKIRYFMYGFGDGMRRAADSATFLQSQVDRVSGMVALGRDEILKYTEQLYKMGLRGGNLQAALEGVSITAATQGDEQAQRFANWAAGAAMTGQSVRKLADDVKARLGGIAARQMLSLDVQGKKLRENMARLFSDLNVEPLLKAISGVLEIFSQTTVTGRALKAFIEGFFQPLINSLDTVGPIVKRFFQGMLIAGLRLGIFVLRLRNWFRDTFGDVELFKGLDKGMLALRLGMFTVFMLVGGLAALLAIGALIAAPFITAGVAVMLALSKIHGAVMALQKLGWRGVADAIVDGFVDGIKDGTKRVVSAISEMGEAAWNALKRKLKMASPSRLFFRGGVDTAKGTELGVKAQTPHVQRAVAEMVPTPREAIQARASFGVTARAGASTRLAEVVQLAPRIRRRAEREQSAAREAGTQRPVAPSAPTAAVSQPRTTAPTINITVNVTATDAQDRATVERVGQSVADEIVRALEAARIHSGGRAA
jgi:hypothetical protein